MTIRVPRDMPPIPSARRERIAAPWNAQLAQAELDLVAHLGGQQLSHCVDDIYPPYPLNGGTGTRRFMVWASACTRAVVVNVVPWGATGSTRTISVAGSYSGGALTVETENPLTWEQEEVDVADDLANIFDPARLSWVVQVQPGALNEITVTTANVALHAISIFEVPRAELRGTETHTDRRLADPRFVLNDDAAGSNVYGVPHLVNMGRRLRTVCKRHPWNHSDLAGIVSSGASGYLLGGAGATNGHRVFARDVRGASVTTCPVACKVYVSGVGGSTFTVTFEFFGGTNAVITDINAQGWWPRAGGQLVDVGQAGAILHPADVAKISFARTAGAGNMTATTFAVVENT